MASSETHNANGDDIDKSANGFLPGTTFPAEKHEQTASAPVSEPPSFPGPDVNGRQTTVTLFSPSQLAQSPFVPSLYNVINEAFDAGHHVNGVTVVNSLRLRYDTQLFEELGRAPGTFTYIVAYTGTSDVVATASGKQYLGAVVVVAKDDEQTRRVNTFRRVGPVADGTVAFELSTMAVDVNLQRQGLAGYLMKLVEDEIKRRFKMIVEEAPSDAKPTRLMTMITTISERNFTFYERRGFVEDYKTWYGPGHIGSETGFTVTNMSKVVDV